MEETADGLNRSSTVKYGFSNSIERNETALLLNSMETVFVLLLVPQSSVSCLEKSPSGYSVVTTCSDLGLGVGSHGSPSLRDLSPTWKHVA